MKVGIDKISFAVPKYYVDIAELAEYRGIDPNKWTIGIGQKKMAVPSVECDVIALAANAARNILEKEDRDTIDMVIVASESGVDYSKSMATYLHQLLEIQPFAKSFEIKQACYGATAGLQMACDYVSLRQEKSVLVIATDIAQYGLKTSGEVTQGAGAVAMLVKSNPRILSLETVSVSHTQNAFDFWRPNGHQYPLVDGKYSTQLYQSEFVTVMEQAYRLYPEQITQTKAVVLHLPFSKMGKKALLALQEQEILEEECKRWLKHYQNTIQFNCEVGNIYTGSLYLSLISLLYHDDTLEVGQTIGLFSYGSGAVSELLFAQLEPNYREVVKEYVHSEQLEKREKLTPEEYEVLFDKKITLDSVGNSDVFSFQDEGVYLKQIQAYQRYYEINNISS